MLFNHAMLRGRKARGKVLLTVLFAAVSVVVALCSDAGSAGATEHQISGTATYDSRCPSHSGFGACLYYDGTSSCFVPAGGNISSSLTFTYCGGTTDGKNHYVLNNANAMECTNWAYEWCRSFVGPNYTGNDDRAGYETAGILYFSWNNEASVEVS